jgi:hypothetical protein
LVARIATAEKWARWPDRSAATAPARAGRRAKWAAEIDALATVRPDLPRQIARDAIAPFYDFDLGDRVNAARQEWLDAALGIMNEQLDRERLGRIRAEAAVKLDAMREQIAELNDALRIDVDAFDLPPIEIPEARLTQGLGPEPLVDSRWSFAEQCRALIDSKRYGDAR